MITINLEIILILYIMCIQWRTTVGGGGLGLMFVMLAITLFNKDHKNKTIVKYLIIILRYDFIYSI